MIIIIPFAKVFISPIVSSQEYINIPAVDRERKEQQGRGGRCFGLNSNLHYQRL